MPDQSGLARPKITLKFDEGISEFNLLSQS
jgi:hypothetical protein